MLEDRPARRRWPRSQRFSLSEGGRTAEAAYRSAVVASRAQEGRASYESARSAWAASCGLLPDDGLYLGELLGPPKTLQEIAAAVETCGKSKEDARLAVERIFDAALIVEVAAPVAPPRRGW